MAEKGDRPIGLTAKPTHSQDFYDGVKRKFAEEKPALEPGEGQLASGRGCAT